MPKRLTTVRLSRRTDEQLAQLCEALGETRTEVIARAVEVLWQQTQDAVNGRRGGRPRKEEKEETTMKTDIDGAAAEVGDYLAKLIPWGTNAQHGLAGSSPSSLAADAAIAAWYNVRKVLLNMTHYSFDEHDNPLPPATDAEYEAARDRAYELTEEAGLQ